MSDQRILKKIAERYDLKIVAHRDRLRPLRGWCCWLALAASLLLCVYWLYADHRAFEARPVAAAHRIFESDCQACHDQSFKPMLRMVTFDSQLPSTSDTQCQHCHAETSHDHLAPPLFNHRPEISPLTAIAVPNIPDDDKTRATDLQAALKTEFEKKACATCHQEHREHGSLTDVADQFCVDCHQKPHPGISNKKYELTFGSFEKHPEFAAVALSDQRKQARPSPLLNEEQWQAGTLADNSHIKFSHQRHLDPELLRPDGTRVALTCVQCHLPASNGADFQPIKFEQVCQQCHQVGFKITGKLPHESMETIRGLLLEKIVRGTKSQSGKEEKVDKIGGPTKPLAQPVKPETWSEESWQNMLEWEALILVDSPAPTEWQPPKVAGLLEAACTKCHELRQPMEGKPKDVEPPRIPDRWMPHSRFRHDRHASVACEQCHTNGGKPAGEKLREAFYPPAKEPGAMSEADNRSIYASQTAKDVLLPNVQLCQKCHGTPSGTPDQPAAGSRCIDCHTFHHGAPTLKPHEHMLKLLTESGKQPAVKPSNTGTGP